MEHFLDKAAETLVKEKPTPPKELSTLLCAYHFPGNIRELESMIFDAISRHESGVLSMESFREKITHEQSAHQTMQNRMRGRMLEQECEPAEIADGRIIFSDRLPTLKEAEQILIDEALKRTDGNQTIAAQLLGLSRRALNNRLRRTQK